MATQNPLLPPGQWVQYNVAVQDPQAPLPSPSEQTIGAVRQAFTLADGPYYQVVWNPGSSSPKTGLYKANQLCPLTQDQANKIIDQLAAGTFQPNLDKAGSQFQQPNVPIQAAPPSQQQQGMYTK